MPVQAAMQPSPRLIRIAGFLAGALGSLALMGLVATVFSGGLSDTPSPLPPVYVIE